MNWTEIKYNLWENNADMLGLMFLMFVLLFISFIAFIRDGEFLGVILIPISLYGILASIAVITQTWRTIE